MSLEIWNKFSKPPITALKTIQAGRLKGKSDINPQWRYQALTEAFGMCGVGWKYTIDKLWTEPGPSGQVFAFANITLYVAANAPFSWCDPIPASGGSMLIAQESSGLHANDEAFKMAITDALGTAAKMIGVAAEIYLGNFDGSKYRNEVKGNIGGDADAILAEAKAAQERVEAKKAQSGEGFKLKNPDAPATEGQRKAIYAISRALGVEKDSIIIEVNGILRADDPEDYKSKASLEELNMKDAGIVIDALQKRQKGEAQ